MIPPADPGPRHPTHSEGRAFGLHLDTGFPLEGLGPAGAGELPGVRLTLASRRALAAVWPGAAEVLSVSRGPSGRVVHRVSVHPRLGYRLEATGFGAFLIDGTATNVTCAPVRTARWRWQRYLVGQVLPFAAALHGYEVFHASAVGSERGTILLLGASGAGKSTLAATLRAGGWRFVADDVVAAATRDGVVWAHGSTGLTSLAHDAAARFPPGSPALGREIARDDGEGRYAIDPAPGPLRVLGLYVLDRSPVGPSIVEDVHPVDPRLLLGATFNLIVQTPDRLTRQLDLCARLAATATMARVRIPPDADPDATAALIDAHARSVVL